MRKIQANIIHLRERHFQCCKILALQRFCGSRGEGHMRITALKHLHALFSVGNEQESQARGWLGTAIPVVGVRLKLHVPPAVPQDKAKWTRAHGGMREIMQRVAGPLIQFARRLYSGCRMSEVVG